MSIFLLVLAAVSFHQTQTSSKPQPDETRAYQYFGSVVGRAGDVDSDGVPDILLGDSGYPSVGVPPMIWIVSGANGTVVRPVRLPVKDLGGSLDEGSLSLCLDGGFDLDGDGVPDFVAGVTRFSVGDSRHVDVVSGKSGKVLFALAAPFRGYDSGGWVHLVTDLDRDAVADIAILCPKDGRGCGSLRFFSGKTHEEILSLPIENAGESYGSFCELAQSDSKKDREFAVILNGSGAGCPSLRIYSLAKRMKTWEQMPGGGDRDPGRRAAIAAVNGTAHDGTTELLVGFDESVELIRISDHAIRFHVGPLQDEEGVGQAVAAPGDLDGDGVSDFVYSIWDPGMYEGMVVAKSGKDGHALWSVRGDLDKDDTHHLGEQLVVVGDLDGDGVSDLAVATNEGPAAVCPGSAAVYSGRTGARLFFFRRRGDDVVIADCNSAPSTKR